MIFNWKGTSWLMSEPTPQFPPPVMDYASPGISPKRFGRSLFGWVLFIALAMMLFFILNSKHKASTPVSLSEFSTELSKGNVSLVVVDSETLHGQYATAVKGVIAFRTEVPQGTTQNWPFMQWLLENRRGAVIRVDNNQNLLVNLLLPLVPWLLIFGFIWFFVFRQLRKNSGPGTTPKPIPVYITTPETK
jgi:ATP-dependent Zn protease